jgi:capsid protein
MRLMQRATYDASKTTPEHQRYWANADELDADSAHSRQVRLTLIKRSRYEIGNNGYADGIAQTYATDLVGKGPALRMQTASDGFNRMVEFQWDLWAKAVGLRPKLWCMAHAKYVDGESLAVLRKNPRVKHAVPLDVVLYEAEQCATPLLPFGEDGYIDGIKFDEFGNPQHYDFLNSHPGSTNGYTFNLKAESVSADHVLHWFKMRRPGQHRGVPESASTLNLGASFRRLREANLTTAEKVAAWTLFLKTMFQPGEEEIEPVTSMSTLEIVHGMMTALPNSVEPFQLRAEHPGPTYDTFHDKLLNEQSRPKSMPRNKAACDSSSYNYASGRLDHQTYYAGLDVEREDGNDMVLDPLFSVWFDLSIIRFGWLGGVPEAISPGARVHLWDWPKHQVADVESEANANRTKLESGQISLTRLYTEQGLDLDDEIPQMARAFGVTDDEVRKRLLDVILPPPKQDARTTPAPVQAAIHSRLNGHAAALNGVHHEN